MSIPVHNKSPSARAIGICEKLTWSGSLANIDSHPLALLGNYIAETNCTCVVEVPAKTELHLKTLLFLRKPNVGAATCEQRLEIHDGSGTTYQFCGSDAGNEVTIDCKDSPSTYYLGFQNDDRNVEVVTVFSIEGKY